MSFLRGENNGKKLVAVSSFNSRSPGEKDGLKGM
jgi:hypothetical protein